LNLDQNVFEANASAANEWGEVDAGVRLDVTGNLSLRRGVDIDLGLMAIVNLDASFSHFLAADLEGEAQAQASIRGQIQLPINLFTEVGLAVRLQAIAELAAGIRLGIGLSAAEFLELTDADPRMQGVPARLIRIFLEEVEVKAGFYAKAALSAQAYANFVITGSAIANPQQGTASGFTIAAGAGAGLKAGAGFQVFARVDVENFSKLVGRSIDVLVDESIKSLASALPDTDTGTRDRLWSLRTPIKISLRLAYELGEQLAVRNSLHSMEGQDQVSLRVLQVILEELQRASLEGFLVGAVAEFEKILNDLQQQAVAAWTACRPERLALADKLRSVPDEPFGERALSYWIETTGLAAAVASRFSTRQPELTRLCATVWSAAQLAAVCAKRAERADAGVSLIGVGARQTRAAFSGTIPNPPPSPIDAAIRAALQQLGTPVSGAVGYEHLVLFLSDATAIALLRQHNPAAAAFLGAIVGPFASDIPALVRLVLKNGGAFPIAGSTTVDPAAALGAVSAGISSFVAANLDTALREALAPAFDASPDCRILYDEVLVPSVRFAVDVVFSEAMAWGGSSTNKDALTEALSAILLRVLGRSLVATGDILLAEAQRNVSALLRKAADEADRADGLVSKIGRQSGVGLAADEILDLVTLGLEVGAEVFGPMPAAKRQAIRGLLYTAIDPLGGATPAEMMQRLNDPGLPDPEVMNALAQELGAYAADRFVVFVEGLLVKIIERQVNAFLAVLDAVVDTVMEWIDAIGAGIAAIGQRLEELGAEIAAVVAEIQLRLEQAAGALGALLDSFSDDDAREKFIDEVAADVSSDAIGMLDDNWVYQNLVPAEGKAAVRSTIRGIVRAAVDNEAVDQVLEIIGGVADEIDDIIDDARAVDRTKPLGPQLRELVLGRIVDVVDDQFEKVKFTVKVGDIDLGKIKIPKGAVKNAIRPMINGVGIFDGAIQAFADAIALLLDAEDRGDALETEQKGLDEEKQRLSRQEAEMRPGPKEVTFERPVALQSVAGDVAVLIRFKGFTTAILDRDDTTPQRVHILLNGEELDLDAFRVDHAADGLRAFGARGALPSLTAGLNLGPASRLARPRSAKAATSERGRSAGLGSGAFKPDRNPIGPGRLIAKQEFVLSGTVPAALLRPGVNTLLVDVIAARDQRVHASVGFAALPAPATVAAPTKPGRRVDVVLRQTLPKARIATASSVPFALPAERRAASETLRRTVAGRTVAPLRRVAALSPKIARRMKLEAPDAPLTQSPRPVLRAVRTAQYKFET
jgi:hypothetical protein